MTNQFVKFWRIGEENFDKRMKKKHFDGFYLTLVYKLWTIGKDISTKQSENVFRCAILSSQPRNRRKRERKNQRRSRRKKNRREKMTWKDARTSTCAIRCTAHCAACFAVDKEETIHGSVSLDKNERFPRLFREARPVDLASRTAQRFDEKLKARKIKKAVE